MGAPPRTRLSTTAAPSSIHHSGHKQTPIPRCAVPPDHHLLITTPSGLYAWDSNGLHKIFKSSKGGILAAKVSKDGNQVLAVADSQVVVLHDCKRGREESWGLNGSDGQVRLLEYAPDAKSLYLSTSLTGAIQCYSVHESRMLDPAQTHPSPPTVLAVNATANLMISASESPPVVYLQNLTLRTPALQLRPTASESAVVIAAFHPERPNVFLLAFKDGTLAAYDATRMARRTGVKMDVNSTMTSDGGAGEISRFKYLHRTTTKGCIDPEWSFDIATTVRDVRSAGIGSRSVGITAAAFVPGYRTRAVSVGGDGRCRMIDFEGDGQILRTWHTQGPVTSLSILSIKDARMTQENRKSEHLDGISDGRRRGAICRRNPTIGGPISTNSLIAIGRVDGRVLLFDSVGLKVQEVSIEAGIERIVGIEWVKGPSPDAIIDGKMLPPRSVRETHLDLIDPETISLYEREQGTPENDRSPSAVVIETPPRIRFGPTISGCDIQSSATTSATYETQGTVLRNTLTIPQWTGPPNPTQSSANYLDLFSPVKQQISPNKYSPQDTSRNLPRPRLSSTTFVRTGGTSEFTSPATAIDPKKSVAFEPGIVSPEHTPRSLFTQRENRSGNSQVNRSSLSPAKRTSTVIMVTPGHMVSSSSSFTTTSNAESMASRNGQILAGLRKVGAKSSTTRHKRKSGNKALFAPYMNRTAAADIRRRSQGHLGQGHGESTHVSPTSRPAEYHEEIENDIWITSGAETEKPMRSQRQRQCHRPAPSMAGSDRTSDIGRPSPVAKKAALHKAADSHGRIHVSSLQTDLPPDSILKSSIRQSVKAASAVRSKRPVPEVQHVHSPQPLRQGPNASILSNAHEVLSSSDQAMHTASECPASGGLIDGDGTFSPHSQDLREMFPRSSSRSPKKSSQPNAKEVPFRALRELPMSAHNKKCSPASPSKKADHACSGCAESQQEIKQLKMEVNKMKAEMLAMKAVLRRAGLQGSF